MGAHPIETLPIPPLLCRLTASCPGPRVFEVVAREQGMTTGRPGCRLIEALRHSAQALTTSRCAQQNALPSGRLAESINPAREHCEPQASSNDLVCLPLWCAALHDGATHRGHSTACWPRSGSLFAAQPKKGPQSDPLFCTLTCPSFKGINRLEPPRGVSHESETVPVRQRMHRMAAPKPRLRPWPFSSARPSVSSSF